MNSSMPLDRNGYPVQVLGLGVAETIDGTSASAQSSVVYSATEELIVRIFAHSDVWVAVGTDPTATQEGTCTPYLSGMDDHIAIPPGYKIAVLGGKLTITKKY
jgi:hypothetical protein